MTSSSSGESSSFSSSSSRSSSSGKASAVVGEVLEGDVTVLEFNGQGSLGFYDFRKLDLAPRLLAFESDDHTLLGNDVVEVLELDDSGLHRIGETDLVYRLVAWKGHQREAPGNVSGLVEGLEEYLLVLRELKIGTELLMQSIQTVRGIYEIYPEKAFYSFERDAVTVSHLLTNF